ncbi:MAG: hypothetical protein NTU74_17985, partial [Deltaproteobacteria bacterium]|nr:hypothetical protein [Deltaproteobacteria bacterium]
RRPGEESTVFSERNLRTTTMGEAEMIQGREVLVEENADIPDGTQWRSASTGRKEGLPHGLSKR